MVGSSRQTVLADPRSDFDVAGPVRLAGRYVAFGIRGRDADGLFTTVSVVDLRTGKARPGYATAALATEDDGLVTALMLRSTGSIAWIACRRFDSGCAPAAEVGRTEVSRRDARGRRLLAAGLDIGKRSLELSDSRVSWVQRGSRRSASLR